MTTTLDSLCNPVLIHPISIMTYYIVSGAEIQKTQLQKENVAVLDGLRRVIS
jgi:hypothetical protein